MAQFSILHLASIDSTNTYLVQQAARRPCHREVIMADEQTAGRGQRGRRWVANAGDALLCSIAWQFDRARSLDGLSLAVGVMVAQAMEPEVSSRLSLKWPNDLLIDETHKTGGILIETVPSPGHTRTAIIGLGLNLKTPDQTVLGVDAMPATGLDACTSRPTGRGEVLARVLAGIASGLQSFVEHDFASFRERWWQMRAFAADEVVARMPDGSQITGHMVELTDRGALVIQNASGLHTLVSGEVSLRATRA